MKETRDPEKIKMAYRMQLGKVHPEEDPEGFKQLRSAYEKALEWASKAEEKTSEVQTPADVWLSRVEAVYHTFSKRVSLPEWTALFEDDLCIGLDTFYEAREKLVVFLMDNFRLPFEVWQLIDQYFHITSDKAELYERFPKNFMDYLLDSIAHPWLLDYSLFEGEDDGDYDAYIERYHKLKALVDEEKELPEDLLSDLENSRVYHPYTDVETARHYIKTGRTEEAYKQLAALHEKHPKDAYILYYLGHIKWEMGDDEGALHAFEALVAENPEHFSALLGMADYCLKHGEFDKAKSILLDLIDKDNQNREIKEKLQLANDALIRRYQELIASGKASGEDKIELGWCYLQNESYDEALALLESMGPEERKLYHYNNLKGRIYLCRRQYQEALPCVLGWIEDIKALADSPDPETQKRKKRLGYAHFAAATCYAVLAENQKGDMETKALEYLDLAMRLEQDDKQRLMYQHYKADFLFRVKRYHESVDVCDEIIKEQHNHYSAHLTKQECCYALEYYQNVVDEYHQCVNIYPYHARPYVLAAKTFWEYRDSEAGMKVVERSKENKISSDELILYESRFLYSAAQNDEDIEKALSICASLLARDKEELDLEAYGDIYHHSAICLADLRRYEEALGLIEKAISINNEEKNYHFVKGNILTAMGRTDEALEIYTSLDREMPNNGNILFKIGVLYEKTDREKEAEDYYNKTLAANPEHKTANFKLMRIYKERLEREQNIELFDKALTYASQQLVVSPAAYYYIERGLIYLDENHFAEALADFTKASELEPDNLYAINNSGMVFRNQERYEEAIPYFEKAAKYAEENGSLLPYGNMGKCYESLTQYEKALECYHENLRIFPEEPSAYKDLAQLLCRMGRFSEALEYYQKALALPRANKKFFLLEIGDLYRDEGNWQKAKTQYEKVIEEYPDYPRGYKRLAELYTYQIGKYRKAEKYLKAILKKLPKDYDSDYEQFAYAMGVVYYLQGKKKKAAVWFETKLQIYADTFGLDNYIRLSSRRQARLYSLGQTYFYLGDEEKARHYFAMMDECPKCHGCSYSQCYERYLACGMICEMDGNVSEAKAQYQKALAIDPYSQEGMLRLRLLEGGRHKPGRKS